MSLAPITLPTDKSTAVIDNAHRSLRQDESGLSITVTVLNADNTAYNLTGKNLVFCENKQNNKIIIDNGHGDNCGTFIRNPDNDTKGIFTYVLQENVYANSGRAWFEIADGNTVDSTKNFYFDVETDAPISITDNDYIGSLKALETAMAGAQDKVTSDLADMENQINQYIASTNTASEAQITQAVKNLTDQTTAALSNVDQYTQKLATLQSQWDSELQNIQTKASADTDSAVKAINDRYTNDFAQLKSDFTNWQTSTTQNYQKQVDDILAKVQQNGTDVADVQKQVDDTVTKMQTLTKQFSNVDFTQFLKPSALDNYYTKSEIDPKIEALEYVEFLFEDSRGQYLCGHDGSILSFKQPLGWRTADNVDVDTITYTSKLFLTNPRGVPENNGGWGYLVTIQGNPSRWTQEWWSDKDTVTGETARHYYRQKTDVNGQSYWAPWLAQATQNDVDSLTKKISDNATAISQNTTAITTKANSADVYTKSDTDGIVNDLRGSIASAGKVKTVNGTQPDSSGNISIAIPDISGKADKTDLSGYETTTAAEALAGRIAALENSQPIKASSQDDAVAKSKNSNNEYYW